MADDIVSVNSENAAEFYATGKVTPTAAPETETANAEVTGEQTESNSVADTDIANEEAETQEEQEKPKTKIDKRFNELTKQREDAKREAAAEREARQKLEKRIAEIEAKSAPEVKRDPEARPQPNQFSDAYLYAEALAEWSANSALQKRDAQVLQEKATTLWKERTLAAEEEIEDYAEALADSSVEVSDAARDAIVDSEVGPKILYHLAKNPEIAESWKTKSASAIIREIGRLEEKLSSSKPTPVTPVSKMSKAPEPIKPVRASSASNAVLDAEGNVTGSYEDFKKAYAAGKIR